MSHLDLLVFFAKCLVLKGQYSQTLRVNSHSWNHFEHANDRNIKLNNYFHETSSDINWNKSIEKKYLKRDWQKLYGILSS